MTCTVCFVNVYSNSFLSTSGKPRFIVTGFHDNNIYIFSRNIDESNKRVAQSDIVLMLLNICESRIPFKPLLVGILHIFNIPH